MKHRAMSTFQSALAYSIIVLHSIPGLRLALNLHSQLTEVGLSAPG
jgi:hypothetical protein